MRPITTGVFERAFDAASIEKVSVRGNNGSISFRLHDDPNIDIKATVRAFAFTRKRAERLGSGAIVAFAQNGGKAQVRVEERGGWRWLGNVEVDFVVHIPRRWSGEVSLKTNNGAIVAEPGSGSRLHYVLRTSNAPIELTGVRGSVHARTSNDAIRVTDATLSGNNHLQTSNGELTFEGGLARDSACRLITSNDHAAVALSDPDVAFEMTASDGHIQLPTDVNVSRLERERVSGRIGNGTARLIVRTSNGSIRFAAKT